MQVCFFYILPKRSDRMRKLRGTLCLFSLLLLIPALLFARHILPIDTRPLVAEKYAGWSGVLNLWIYESWPCGHGSFSPWLNQCIAGFERVHPGVYVQPQFVDDGAITSMKDSGILPPDMLLFPPWHRRRVYCLWQPRKTCDPPYAAAGSGTARPMPYP